MGNLSQDALSTVANVASIAASVAAFILSEHGHGHGHHAHHGNGNDHHRHAAQTKNTANNVLTMIGSALSIAVKFLGEKKYDLAQDALSTVANVASIAASVAAFILPEDAKVNAQA